jgi:hypothetical protein
MNWRAAGLGLVVTLGAAAVLVQADTGDIAVTPLVSDGQVSASFSAPAGFDDDAKAILGSGLALTFNFTVELRRPSSIWLDHTLTTTNVSATGKFDPLAGVYQVSRLQESKVVWAERTEHPGDVQEWMTHFDRVPLQPSEPLQPNGDYYVRVRMQASPKRTLILWPWSDGRSGRAAFTFIR